MKYSIIKKHFGKLCSVAISLAMSVFCNCSCTATKGSAATTGHQIYLNCKQCTEKTGHHLKTILKMPAAGFENQLKSYLEKLSDSDLRDLYNGVFKLSYKPLCEQKLRIIRAFIPKIQSERAFKSIMQGNAGYKSKKKMLPQKKNMEPVTPKKSYVDETKTKNTPNPTKKEAPNSEAVKTPAIGVIMHTCACCKKFVPIGQETSVFKCKNCGHERKKFICERCDEERCAKIMCHLARVQRKCRACGYKEKIAK